MLVGDGVADDLAALQAAIDACPSYGTVTLDPVNTHRLVISGSVPERGLVLKPNTTLNLNGARLNYECHGDVYCTRPTNGSKIVNGRINLTVSDGLTSEQAVYHAPISIGSAYSEILSLTNKGPYIEAEGWTIDSLEIGSMKPANGWGICGLGGFQSGKIRDVDILDSATLWGGIDFDWGTLGLPGTIPQNRANFGTGHAPSGTFRGIHPKNIWMDHIRIGRLTNPLSEGIRMSGCDAFSINNVFIKHVGASGFSHYGGDQGHEFCEYGPNRYQAYQNTVVRDLTIANVAPTGSAIRLDAWADNIAREPGYTPLTPVIYPSNILIDGLVADGSNIGMKVGSIAGGIIRRARLNGFHIGVEYNPGVTRHVFEDSVIHGGDSTAIKRVGNWSGVTENRVVFEY